jgi:hypothetical protein
LLGGDAGSVGCCSCTCSPAASGSGGFVVIAVVTFVVRRELSVAARVALFRSLGRSCGIVRGLALGVALLTGGGLLSQRGWASGPWCAVVLAPALVVATEPASPRPEA